MLRATAAAVHPVLAESGEPHPFEMRLDQPLSARMSPRGSYPCLPVEDAPCGIWLYPGWGGGLAGGVWGASGP